MRKVFTAFLIGLTVSVAFATGRFGDPVDLFRFGLSTSSDDKEIEFNVGDGALNPKMSVDTTNKDFDFNKDINVTGDINGTGLFSIPGFSVSSSTQLDLGSAAPGSYVIQVDRGGSNPVLQWNETSGAWEFSNDGTLFKKIGSGAGGGGGGINLLSNASFEDPGSPILNWTNSGGTLTQEDHTNSREGNLKFARFVATLTGQFLESDPVTVTDDIGSGCMADFNYTQGDNAFDYVVLKSPYAYPADVISEGSLSDLSTFLKAPTITFPCNPGDLLKLRIVSTGAGTVDIDEAYLGSNKNISPVGKNSHFIGSIQWAPTTNCQWSVASVGSFSDWPSDADCDDNARTLVGEAQDSSAGLLPQVTFPYLPKGHYKLVFMGSFGGGGTNTYQLVRATDGTNNSNISSNFAETGSPRGGTFIFEFDYSSDQTNVTFKLQGQSATSATLIRAIEQNAKLALYYFPNSSETQEAFTPEQADFFYKGYIAGANPNFSSSESSPVEPNNGSLSLTNVNGSCKIACVGANPATGTTCSGGNESIGVVCNLPRAGKYKVSAKVVNQVGNTVFSQGIYKMQNASTTIDQVPTKITQFRGNSSTGSAINTLEMENVFDIASAGEHTFKLLYTTNNANSIDWLMDQVEGDRKAVFRIEMVGHNVSRPIIQNMVSTTFLGGKKTESCRVSNSGTPTIDTASGLCESWVDSLDDNGVGNVDINITPGTFSGPVVCQVMQLSSAVNGFCKINNDSNSSTSVDNITCRNANNDANVDTDFTIQCEGVR